MIGIRRAAGVAVVLAALVLPRPANNAVEQTIIDTPISERERLEQMASRGEIRSLTMEITAYTMTRDARRNGLARRPLASNRT
jgi:hypothetical protein